MLIDGVRKVNESILKEGRALTITFDTNDINHFPAGTLNINPDTGDLKFIKLDKNKNKEWSNFTFENLFKTNSFNSNLILDNSIHSNKILDRSITSSKIASNTITSENIKNESIDSIAIKSLDGTKINNRSITSSKIVLNSITKELIANKTIDDTNIKDNSITNNLLALNLIENHHLSLKCIETKNIKEKSITNILLQDEVVNSNNLKKNSILNEHLNNEIIKHCNIKEGSIYGNLIPDFSIKDNHIDSLDGFKIKDNSINSFKLQDDSIINEKIKDASISFNKLDNKLKDVINNSLKIESVIELGEEEFYNTALIKGSLVLKNFNNSKTNLSVDGDIKATGDIIGERVFHPYFADVAEAYIPTEYMVPGDPVCLCKDGDLKIERLNKTNSNRFLGFISNEYATLLGATKDEIISKKKIPVALIGRIKIKLEHGFQAKLGEYLCLIENLGIIGVTKRRTEKSFGRLLEDKDFSQTQVLCQLWP